MIIILFINYHYKKVFTHESIVFLFIFNENWHIVLFNFRVPLSSFVLIRPIFYEQIYFRDLPLGFKEYGFLFELVGCLYVICFSDLLLNDIYLSLSLIPPLIYSFFLPILS